ncbi:MAG: hypothetical protein OXQ94_00055 [Gemmatimonadota bacterium]|nr:hypothetical protein [Gemmatimonadota bacterium]
MSNEFRDSVWEGMVHADRLRRYYGRLAGRMAKVERAMTVAALVLALVTAFLANAGHALLLPAAVLTAVATALPLIFRLGDRITEAAYCGKRLSDLYVDWEDLWQEAYRLQPHDPVDHRLAERRRVTCGLDERDHRAEGAGARKQGDSQGNPG